ncbi:MAG: serine hydrolase [Gammaproteobacteria bacterium]|nr:serine hydrolase [Gammaproteobacteria bacterium]
MPWDHGALPEPVTPESEGMDSERLSLVDGYLQGYVDQEKLAGSSFAVMRRGRLVYYNAFGHARRETEQPMAADTIHRIYSMSKPITSVALLTLYEQGKFQLDDPIEKYLPEFAEMRVLTGGSAAQPVTRHATASITPRHIMTHTAGLTYGFEGVPHAVDEIYRYRKIGNDKQTLAEFTEALGKAPLRFDPGTSWNYSYGTDVQGRLIEALSGMRFDDYLQSTLFDPLGMVDTSFTVAADKADRLANNYTRPRGPLELFEDATDSPYLRQRVFKSGGGGLTSTLPDYMRFGQMLANKGELDGARVLGRKTVEYATSNHLPGGADMEAMGAGGFAESAFRGVGFCLIGSVCIDPVAAPNMQSLGDYGWGGAAGTRFWVDPQEDLMCVFMTQFMPGGRYPVQEYLRHLVLQSIVD